MKRSFFSTRTLAAGFGILSMALLFAACNKFDNDDNNSGNNAAGLMAFNLAPDQGALGFAITGNVLTNQPLGYTSYTGSYLGIYPGSRAIDAFDFTSNRSIATATASFEPNKFYSVFFVGADSNYRNVIVQDNYDSLSAASGQAFVRYINAIPDSSAPSVSIAAGGSNVVNENAAFAKVSEFTPIAPGEIAINVSNGGTISKSRTITIEQKKAYTILLSGRPGATGADSLAIKFISNGTLSDAPQQRAASQQVRSN